MAGFGRQNVAPEADPSMETSVAASAAPKPSKLFDQSLPNLLHLDRGLHQPESLFDVYHQNCPEEAPADLTSAPPQGMSVNVSQGPGYVIVRRHRWHHHWVLLTESPCLPVLFFAHLAHLCTSSNACRICLDPRSGSIMLNGWLADTRDIQNEK